MATAMANGHLVNARTPMDVNLAKQLNILVSDMGMPWIASSWILRLARLDMGLNMGIP